jgi:aminoglycoside 6'-N-acetyltransferase I
MLAAHELHMKHKASTRQATIDELEITLPLLERFFAEEGFQAPPGQIRAELAGLLSGDESAVFLAWLDGVAVGVATVTTTRGLELGYSAEMEDLYVLPEARGQGVGSTLIEAVKSWCRSGGCTQVAVVVTPEGQAAHHLIEYYRSRGFQETGRTLLFAPLEQEGSPPYSENQEKPTMTEHPPYTDEGFTIVARVIQQKGYCGAGHHVGDEVIFDGQTVQGKVCIHALYSFLPKVLAMRYGAEFPWLQDKDVATHPCPDAWNPVVFEIRRLRT